MLDEFGKKFKLYGIAGGNTGMQMGGWFRKEIKTVDDFKGLKMRIGGWAGKTRVQARRRSAADRRRRHLSGAGEGHHRRHRVGRSVRRREARLLQGRQILLLSGLVGGRHGATLLRSTAKSGMHCRRPTSRCSPWRAATPTWTCRRSYDARNPQALKRLVANGAQLRPFSQQVMEACLKASNEVNAETSAANADFKKIYEFADGIPQRRISVVAGRGIHLRDLHDPHPPEGVRQIQTPIGGWPSASPFFGAPGDPSPTYNFDRSGADWI